MSNSIDITVYDVRDFAEQIDTTATPEVQIEQTFEVIARTAGEIVSYANELECIDADDLSLDYHVDSLLDHAYQLAGLRRHVQHCYHQLADKAALAMHAADEALEADPANEKLKAEAAAAEVAWKAAEELAN